VLPAALKDEGKGFIVVTETSPMQRRGMGEKTFALFLITPALLVVTFVIVYPLINAFVTSFFRSFLTDVRGRQFVG
jgi:ABC-type sugar transport system permease subunit